jgi:hypothetical protein
MFDILQLAVQPKPGHWAVRFDPKGDFDLWSLIRGFNALASDLALLSSDTRIRYLKPGKLKFYIQQFRIKAIEYINAIKLSSGIPTFLQAMPHLQVTGSGRYFYQKGCWLPPEIPRHQSRESTAGALRAKF